MIHGASGMYVRVLFAYRAFVTGFPLDESRIARIHSDALEVVPPTTPGVLIDGFQMIVACHFVIHTSRNK